MMQTIAQAKTTMAKVGNRDHRPYWRPQRVKSHAAETKAGGNKKQIIHFAVALGLENVGLLMVCRLTSN